MLARLACMPPSISARSSTFIVGIIKARVLAMTGGGMLPTMAWWIPTAPFDADRFEKGRHDDSLLEVQVRQVGPR